MRSKRFRISFWFTPVLIGAMAVCSFAQIDTTATGQADKKEFRFETTPVAAGAEIVTIFARRKDDPKGDLPLLSVLRDTLGDKQKENDRLRQVWMLTYTEPSLSQKASALVPFLYGRTTNNKTVGNEPPPKLVDLNGTGGGFLQKFGWFAFRKIILSDLGVGPRASVLQYKENVADYRRSAMARAVAVLSVSEPAADSQALDDTERHDITARLALKGKLFGDRMSSDNLARVYSKELRKNSDFRNQNWELLRQYSERQGLYFQPLTMPDGTARHAIVWAAAEDLEPNRGRKYDSRFLNIKNPWADSRLIDWKGYSETRWYDSDGREVADPTPGATKRTLIPLAVYGLDHPKIPALLIDFRDGGNAKRREMSRRLISDVTSNVLSVSPLASLPYFAGHWFFGWFTGRRGMDINQISRVRSYSQLKLFLALDSSLDEGLRSDIAKRIEKVTLNPLENDLDTETMIARRQYENLMEYARRPDGLPAKIDHMRREEMVKIAHGPKERALFSLAHAFTLGLYTHREKPTPELLALIDTRRRLEFHERRVAEIARGSVRPEVDSNVQQLRSSLAFISTNGSAAKDKTVRSLARLYAITDDADLRDLCVAGLYKINNEYAKNELLAIYRNPHTDDHVRGMSARYLKLAVSEGQRMSSRNVAAISAIGTN